MFKYWLETITPRTLCTLKEVLEDLTASIDKYYEE